MYKSVAEIKVFIEGITGSLPDLSDEILSLLRGSFITAFEEQCGYPLEPVNEVRKFNGSGSDIIVVDPYQSIDSITITSPGVTLMITDFIELVHSKLIKNAIGVQVPYSSYLGYPLFNTSSLFLVGNRNVSISATWGLAEVPDDVNLLLCYYVMGMIQSMKKGADGGLMGVDYMEIDREIRHKVIDPSRLLPPGLNYRAVLRRYKVNKRLRQPMVYG